MQDIIPVLVLSDEAAEELGSGILPSSLRKGVASIVEVDSKNLASELKNVVDELHNIVNSVTTESEQYAVEYIDFSLGLSKTGKIGILSTIEASNINTATMTVRLRRR